MRRKKRDYQNTYQIIQIRPATWSDLKRIRRAIVEYVQVEIELPFSSEIPLNEVIERTSDHLEPFFGPVKNRDLYLSNELAFDINFTGCFSARYINRVSKNKWNVILNLKSDIDILEWKNFTRKSM